MPQTTLGVVAGAGALPFMVKDFCRARGRPVFVLALEGHADPAVVRDVPHAWIRVGAAGRGLEILHRAGVRELVLAGAVRRPGLLELRPDWRTMAFLAKVGRKAMGGDNALLRAVILELEAEGFRVIGVDGLIEDLVAAVGLYGGPAPDDQAWTDIGRGVEVARRLGALDVGQGAVVQQGLVLAVETVEGTDAMLARCGSLARQGPGGVLVKVCKPDQERRADLPTIGMATLSHAAAAGLRGIAVEAGSALVVDRQAMAEQAGRLGVFVIGIDPAMPCPDDGQERQGSRGV